MAVKGCRLNTEIPRVSFQELTLERFHNEHFKPARPVIITNMADDWPCMKWTIEGLMDRVGDNEVLIRGKTDKEDYKLGKSYVIRRDSFRNYCSDLLQANARAKSSYLAVASLHQAFPQLLDDVPFPDYLSKNGKLHLGPYMWVALKNHYEFCHFDPDDNFLLMIKGRKQVRLFDLDCIEALYPNPLGSQGKTIQSQVNLDYPDLEKYPNFKKTHCQHTILHPGEALFIPAFYWHQVTALDTGISCNFFYGDAGSNQYLEKVLDLPYRSHFQFWLLNILEQNKSSDTFPKLVARLPEVLAHFFLKQWHEEATPDQIERVISMINEQIALDNQEKCMTQSKFPPPLKIRGLRGRVAKEEYK